MMLIIVTSKSTPADIGQLMKNAVDALDRGEPLAAAIADLRPDMWKGLPDGAARQAVKTALAYLFANPPVGTEARLRQRLRNATFELRNVSRDAK